MKGKAVNLMMKWACEKAGVPKVSKSVQYVRGELSGRRPEPQGVIRDSTFAMTDHYTKYGRSLKAVAEQRETSLGDKIILRFTEG